MLVLAHLGSVVVSLSHEVGTLIIGLRHHATSRESISILAKLRTLKAVVIKRKVVNHRNHIRRSLGRVAERSLNHIRNFRWSLRYRLVGDVFKGITMLLPQPDQLSMQLRHWSAIRVLLLHFRGKAFGWYESGACWFILLVVAIGVVCRLSGGSARVVGQFGHAWFVYVLVMRQRRPHGTPRHRLIMSLHILLTVKLIDNNLN